MKRGFTLIEVMVTVTIIALLSVMVISGYGQQQRRARDARRIADGGSVGIAIESYKAANGSYPNSTVANYTYKNIAGVPLDVAGDNVNGTVLEKSLNDLVTQGLINTLPKDPKGVAITGVDSDDPPFCLTYSYKSNVTDPGMGNDLAAEWAASHPGQTVGPRSWVIRIATEIAANAQNEHPLDASVIATSPTYFSLYCNNSRGYAYILGPKM